MDHDTDKPIRMPDKTLTIKDVAQRAGVSVATVSRVLNNHDRVDPELRERVQNVVRELGFIRNLMASSLVRQRSESIGLILPHMVTFFVPLVNEIERVTQAHGKSLVVATRLYHTDAVFSAVDFLKERRCGAIILHPGSTRHDDVTALLRDEPRLVLVHRWYPEYRERCVIVNNRLGARLATQHLIDRGHRDIALITGPTKNPECDERVAGFCETMEAARLKVHPELVKEGDYRMPSGDRCMAQLLQSGKSFSAVFCLSDEMAAGAIRYARFIGKLLPQELSIVGFDDIVFADQLHPRLTTVRQPLETVGRMAAERALALDAGIDLPSESTIIAPELVIRDSVLNLKSVALANEVPRTRRSEKANRLPVTT